MQDRRRFFGVRERRALFLAADGKCEICGTNLPSDWHADHIRPWSVRGETKVGNGQALCPACNLRKGSSVVFEFNSLRPWQKRAVETFQASQKPDLLITALPGGGKTVAALYAAKNWREEASDRARYVVVVCPNSNVREQWFQAAPRFGIQLQAREFSGTLKPGMNGCVITYQMLANQSLLFQKLCQKHEVFAIFDEVHHVGELASWGDALLQGFSSARKRLALSGTPWRSNGSRIPFLTMNEETGEYEADVRFDWPEALEGDYDALDAKDRPAVRLLSFRPFHGYAEYERDGEVLRLSSHETLTDDDVARCLRGRLMERQFVCDVLREAHEKLLSLRETKPDAAGIAVCIDIPHAQNVARWLREITGEEPKLATSDDDVSPGKPVLEFNSKGASHKWIVSVRQVSEGVDIPRLMVGTYLTNYTTELFFRQFVGRIVRYQGTSADKEAHVYYPHHPRLNAYAEKILELQAIAIAIQPHLPKGTDVEGPERQPSPVVYLGGSAAEPAGLILPGLGHDAVCGPRAANNITAFATRYAIPETTSARILRDLQGLAVATLQDDGEDVGADAVPLEERCNHLRRAQQKRIAHWAALTGREHKVLNNEANMHAGCSSVDAASEEQLLRRRVYIAQRIREAQTPRHA